METMSSPFESSRLEVTSSIADRPTVASVAGASEGEVSKTSFVSAAGLSVNFPFHGRGPESRLALIRSHVGSHPCPFQDIWRNQHNSRCGNSTSPHGGQVVLTPGSNAPDHSLCLCGATGRTLTHHLHPMAGTPQNERQRSRDTPAPRLAVRGPSPTLQSFHDDHPALQRWHPARSRLDFRPRHLRANAAGVQFAPKATIWRHAVAGAR